MIYLRETQGCDLTFSYHVDLQEPQFLDIASVFACNGATCERLMHTHDGDFVFESWETAQRPISLEAPFWIEFRGSVDDGLANDGTGYSIDDVEIRCADAVVTPATDATGMLVLLATMSVAFVVTLLLRRRRCRSVR